MIHTTNNGRRTIIKSGAATRESATEQYKSMGVRGGCCALLLSSSDDEGLYYYEMAFCGGS